MDIVGHLGGGRRAGYAALAAGLAVAIAALLTAAGDGWWQLVAFGAGPDLALLAGAGAGMAAGRLHPRAVPAYNALHRFAGPVAMLAIVMIAGLGAGWAVGALAWGVHIAIDRAVGYGLREADGSQRA